MGCMTEETLRSDPQLHRNGDGTRPATDGGVDNMGGGRKFKPGGAETAPAPPEGMAEARLNAEATRHDESAALGLAEDLTPETSRDPTQPLDGSAL